MSATSTFNAAEIAEALSASCAASMDLSEALRAGSVSPADNVGSGETLQDLLDAAIVSTELVQRASPQDWGLVEGKLNKLVRTIKARRVAIRAEELLP